MENKKVDATQTKVESVLEKIRPSLVADGGNVVRNTYVDLRR